MWREIYKEQSPNPGWSIIDNDDGLVVAYLGPDVYADEVSAICALHNEAIRLTANPVQPVAEAVAWQNRQFDEEENAWGMWRDCSKDVADICSRPEYAGKIEVRSLAVMDTAATCGGEEGK